MAQQLSKQEALDLAIRDAAARAGVGALDVTTDKVEDATFPNAALGAQRAGEMSFEVISPGWTFQLSAGGQRLEYRANGQQVRLADFGGRNHLIYPA